MVQLTALPALKTARQNEEPKPATPTAAARTSSPRSLGPTRGPLKLEIGTSSPTLEAGRSFSVLLTISNPFDVAISITRATTVLPIEFTEAERDYQKKERQELFKKAHEISQELITATIPELEEEGRKQKRAAVGTFVREVAQSIIPLGRVIGAAYDMTRVITASKSRS